MCVTSVDNDYDTGTVQLADKGLQWDLDFDRYKNATLDGHSCTITDHIIIKMAC